MFWVRLQLFLAALWWGSLTVVGALVVPTLFMVLEPAALAGQVAAQLFSAECWLGVVSGLLLILAGRRTAGEGAYRPSAWVLLGMLAALLLEVAVTPRIVARENLMLWHNVGTALYAVQWLAIGRWLWSWSVRERVSSTSAS
jgi:hypothetical protein